MNYDQAVQKKLVDSICESLPADDEWDETNAFEKAYKSNNLKRYKLDKLLLSKQVETDAHKEVLITSGTKDHKSSQPALGPPDKAVIKIQNQKHVELLNLLKVTKSAASSASSLASLMRNLLPAIVTCSSPEGILTFSFLFSCVCQTLSLNNSHLLALEFLPKKPNVDL